MVVFDSRNQMYITRMDDGRIGYFGYYNAEGHKTHNQKFYGIGTHLRAIPSTEICRVMIIEEQCNCLCSLLAPK